MTALKTNQNKHCYGVRVWARWVQGLIIELINFFATLKMLKKRRNTRFEKCYGHANIATTYISKASLAIFCSHSTRNKYPILFTTALQYTQNGITLKKSIAEKKLNDYKK